MENKIGQSKCVNCGDVATIIEYKNYKDIVVKFASDGTTVRTRYSNFQKGKIRNPNFIKTHRTGQETITKYGEKIKVVEYKNYNNIIIELSDGTRYKSSWRTFEAKNFIKPKEHIGEKKRVKNGMMLTITYYKNNTDIWAQFSDGTIVNIDSYDTFLRGNVAHPDDTSKMQAILRIGEKKKMHCGLNATIVRYNSARNIDVLFEDGYLAKKRPYKDFLIGKIKSPNAQFSDIDPKRKERMGQRRTMHCGLIGEIVGYRKSYDIDVKFDGNDEIIKHRTYGEFLDGVICPSNWRSKRNRASFNELYVAMFLEPMGFKRYQHNYYKALGLGKKELDLYNEQLKIAIEYDGQAYHRNPEKDKEKDDILYKQGIFLYRIREPGCPTYCTNPNVKFVELTTTKWGNENLKISLRKLAKEIAQKYGVDCSVCKDVDYRKVCNYYHSPRFDVQKRVGEQRIMKNGMEVVLVAWHNSDNVDVKIKGIDKIFFGCNYGKIFKRGIMPKKISEYIKRGKN